MCYLQRLITVAEAAYPIGRHSRYTKVSIAQAINGRYLMVVVQMDTQRRAFQDQSWRHHRRNTYFIHYQWSILIHSQPSPYRPLCPENFFSNYDYSFRMSLQCLHIHKVFANHNYTNLYLLSASTFGFALHRSGFAIYHWLYIQRIIHKSSNQADIPLANAPICTVLLDRRKHKERPQQYPHRKL